MNKILLAAIPAALLLAAAPAFAKKEKGPPEGARTFEVSFPPPGSSWAERTVFQDGKSNSRTFTAMKDGVDKGKPVYRASSEKTVMAFNHDSRSLVWLGAAGKEELRFSPHYGSFSPPLWAGKKWIHIMAVIDPVKGERAGPMRVPFQVEGLEDVTVPAGTFKALKIRRDGAIDWVEGMMSDLIKQTDWFVPGLGLVVKTVKTVNADNPGGAGTITMEVVSIEGIVTRRLADDGASDAQVEMGLKFDKGLGVEVDPEEALAWYRKAAAQGNDRAMNMLGVVYFAGRGVARDYAQSLNWYKQAAEKGNANAQFNLGLMYEKGQGAAADKGEAKKWLGKAAAQGHALAKKRLDSKD